MTLKDKIGQLLIAGFKGDRVSVSSPVIQAIEKHNLGGVILFDRLLAEKSSQNNIISFKQTKALIGDLQSAAGNTLIVSVDQEGGLVNRFKKERGFPQTPQAAQLGEHEDTGATTAAAQQTAGMLAEMGFTLNLAPVADLNLYRDNPIIGKYGRAFSDNCEKVALHAECWIREHHQNGLQCCLKHFPGHGSARNDSHLGLVDISSYWRHDELLPFRKLIESGLVDSIMTGHLFNERLDPKYPATLSGATVNGLLRGELGFTGPVLSDDMQMQAITDHYGLEECVIRALNSGVDLLVFGNNMVYDPDITEHVITIILKALHNGSLEEAQLEAAWQRVQRLRQLPLNNI
ncbi:glycoside hydrolase family 3 protein [Desulfosediminicola ganghwensis]|uniref:glycoside hydrolase family 3 protein n=1 Tax=Desulfosediminicola ganghwensis TaxID=2569540 RepID=UPI0010ABD336|nr:glycoside hydrolase family 3 N-terminal domain-containing protein [Desulfosediminicola ganghwensis]